MAQDNNYMTSGGMKFNNYMEEEYKSVPQKPMYYDRDEDDVAAMYKKSGRPTMSKKKNSRSSVDSGHS